MPYTPSLVQFVTRHRKSASLPGPTISLPVTAVNVNRNCWDLSLKLLGEEGEILIFLRKNAIFWQSHNTQIPKKHILIFFHRLIVWIVYLWIVAKWLGYSTHSLEILNDPSNSSEDQLSNSSSKKSCISTELQHLLILGHMCAPR